MHTHSRHHEAKKATLWGALKNTILAAIKVIVGIVGQSHALLADGIHSASDLLTDILVLLAAHWGSKEADINHPYGHQRIETAGSVFVAFFLILAGLAIAYDAAYHLLLSKVHDKPDIYVLIIAFISVLLNEAIFRYTLYTAKKIKSNLLLANAWHHRSDAASSLVVLLGVAGTAMGYYWLDSAAAFVIGLMIIKMGGELAWTSICELVDTGVEPAMLEKITNVILQNQDVRAVHQLRTRSMAGAIFVDVHILVDSWLSVSEGHYIAEKVHKNLIKEIENVNDVTVHVDSEDDKVLNQSLELPTRKELFEILKAQSGLPWDTYSPQIVLHYLEGKISLDVYAEELKQEYDSSLNTPAADITILDSVNFYYKAR